MNWRRNAGPTGGVQHGYEVRKIEFFPILYSGATYLGFFIRSEFHHGQKRIA